MSAINRYRGLALEDRQDLCRERLFQLSESAQALYLLKDYEMVEVLEDVRLWYAQGRVELVEALGDDDQAAVEGGAA